MSRWMSVFQGRIRPGGPEPGLLLLSPSGRVQIDPRASRADRPDVRAEEITHPDPAAVPEGDRGGLTLRREVGAHPGLSRRNAGVGVSCPGPLDDALVDDPVICRRFERV